MRLRIRYYSRGSVNKCKLKIINRPIWEQRLATHVSECKAPAIEIILENRIYPPLTPYNILPHEAHERKLDEIQAINVIT